MTRLPEKQIDTYYANIETSDETIPLETKICTLASALSEFSFPQLEQTRVSIVENSRCDTSNKILEVEQLKALTGLYLTVAYVAVKNLIKTNARYYIAFSAFERDYHLFCTKDKLGVEQLLIPFKGKDNKTEYNEILALTRYFLKKEDENDYKPAQGQPFDKEACRRHLDSIRRHFSKKWRDIFRQNINEALRVSPTGDLPILVRNHAAHLNVLSSTALRHVEAFHSRGGRMQSYFELYHFLLQKLLCENDSISIPAEYREILSRGEPCQDLIKISYVSLGYNLPRYKNLTIEALFDEDSESGKQRTP